MPKPIKAIAFGVVKRYKQKKAVSFAQILAPAERSFVELTKQKKRVENESPHL